ncbi:unnamed protein product [Moneuplotes crassus]|uniref:Uncharacterized protein n=1 Tax=Euplotes crassus TaxID=5936 RepID=A0AAD2D160_EUPCR|nr:unnamed protein product [Moneuplotes crassus]
MFGGDKLKMIGEYNLKNDEQQKRMPKTAAISKPFHLIRTKKDSSYFNNSNEIFLNVKKRACSIITKMENEKRLSKTFYKPSNEPEKKEM